MLYIVTPLDLTKADWFLETAQSVAECQKLFELTWIIGVDTKNGVYKEAYAQKVLSCIPKTLGKRTKMVFSKGGSAAVVRNTIFENIPQNSKNWVFLLDADDLLVPSAMDIFLKQIEKIKLHFDWVASGRKTIGLENIEKGTARFGNNYVLQKTSEGLLAAPDSLKWTRPMMFHPNSIMFRSSCLCNVQYPEHFSYEEDLTFLFKLASLYNGYVLSQTVLEYRKWDGQTTAEADFHALRPKRFKLVLKEIDLFRKEHGIHKMQSFPILK